QAALDRIADHTQPVPLGELKALSDLDEDGVDLLGAEWRAIEPSHRRAVAQAMQELGEASPELDFREAFVSFLGDEDPQVRTAALKGLWEDTRRSTLRKLLAAMAGDPDEGAREAAATTLGAWTLQIAEGRLDQRISDEIEQAIFAIYSDQKTPLTVRRRALEALGYLGEQPAIAAAIDEAHRSPDELWQQSAIFAMGRSGQTRWRAAIKQALGHGSPAMRYEAARAVGELGDQGRPLLQTMAPLVADHDTEVSLAAIWALGQVGGTAARRMLEGLVREAEGDRQEAAESALSELKFYADPMVSPPVEFDLDDDDEDEEA
ncbi:MAG TPA: HEAT repeat domain-containing protein, partial [Herpetosiphonaceae bacterium]